MGWETWIPMAVMTYVSLLVVMDKMKRRWGENPPKFFKKGKR